MANGMVKACWLRQLLLELHNPLSRATLIYCDNVSAIYLSTNPIQHQRIKHVEIDLHFVCDRVTVRDVRVLHVPTTSQFIDIFTKGLLPQCSQSFGPISTSVVARVLTAGVLECVSCMGCVCRLYICILVWESIDQPFSPSNNVFLPLDQC
jgi:hypothetical protein